MPRRSLKESIKKWAKPLTPASQQNESLAKTKSKNSAKKAPAKRKRSDSGSSSGSDKPLAKIKKARKTPVKETPASGKITLPFYIRLQLSMDASPEWPISVQKILAVPQKRKEKVSVIKEMISKDYGFPVDSFDLHFQGGMLKDEYDLLECDISATNVVTIFLRQQTNSEPQTLGEEEMMNEDDDESKETEKSSEVGDNNLDEKEEGCDRQKSEDATKESSGDPEKTPKTDSPACSGTSSPTGSTGSNRENLLPEEEQDNPEETQGRPDVMAGEDVESEEAERSDGTPMEGEGEGSGGSGGKEGAEGTAVIPDEPFCDLCKDDPKKKCNRCVCKVCKRKKEAEQEDVSAMVCDECNQVYHIECAGFDELPEDDFYCDECKLDTNEVNSRDGTKKKKIKRQFGQATTDRANRGKAFQKPDPAVCKKFGPIPGIEVGQTYYDRMTAYSSGVHGNHMDGIVGDPTRGGAFSICSSGGYDDDEDQGDVLMYTGSGGTELKEGNKRVAKQSKDQNMNRSNEALARGCSAPFSEDGGDAGKRWREGKALRVMRGALKKRTEGHSGEYAPVSGYRYDGIYKVVRYWKAKGVHATAVWKYELRRDDPQPPPWTTKGQERIKALGLKMKFPPMGEMVHRMMEEGLLLKGGHRTDTPIPRDYFSAKKPTHDKAAAFEIPECLKGKIQADKRMKCTWAECVRKAGEGKVAFGEAITEEFSCAISACDPERAHDKVTLSHENKDKPDRQCEKVYCLDCAKKTFADRTACPFCNTPLVEEGQTVKVYDYRNEEFEAAMEEVEKVLHAH